MVLFMYPGYTQNPSNYNYMRQSVPGIYSMLIGDLRYAYDHLPDVSEQNLSADFGRPLREPLLIFGKVIFTACAG